MNGNGILYTSNFRYLYARGLKAPVSIALIPPSDYSWKEYKKLAPLSEWWSEWHDMRKSGEYTEQYLQDWYTDRYIDTVLCMLDQDKVIDDLLNLYGNEVPLHDITLLCYEPRGEFCHRHLVADWLMKAGYKVIER